MSNDYFNTIVPFRQDLGENIITDVSVDSACETTTEITFHNPVTGSTDRVIFEGQDPHNIDSIFYIINYKIGGYNEELIMEDLIDLYDFILIDEKE